MVPVRKLLARPTHDKVESYDPPLNVRAVLTRKAWYLRGETDLALPDGLAQACEAFMCNCTVCAGPSGVSFNPHISQSSGRL